jgi:hypothetical protein
LVQLHPSFAIANRLIVKMIDNVFSLQQMLESTDPIDAAYWHLRTPDAARQVVWLVSLLSHAHSRYTRHTHTFFPQLTLRMSLLLSPLTGSSAPLGALSSLPSSEVGW